MCLSVAGRVVRVEEDRPEAIVEVRGVSRRVSLSLMSLEGRPVSPGDWLVVSVGLALERITEAQAAGYEPWFKTAQGSRTLEGGAG